MDILNEQQKTFLNALLDPKSNTWGNYLQSGLKAGYSQEYSESISYQMPDWLSENLGKTKLVQKAEKNLENALDGLMDDPEKGGKQIQWKATEMTLRTLKKDDYSERQEVTGKDGAPFVIQSINYGENNNTTSQVPAKEISA